MKAKTVLNYFGQLRLYSLVDLLLMLYASGMTDAKILGPVFIWVAFLAHLESRHKDLGRAVVPYWVAIILTIMSIPLFGVWKGLLFSLISLAYTKKKAGWWGLVSPFCRGLQVLCMLGITEFGLMAAAATTVRNALGDWRDVEQDRVEGLKTWPVVLGVKSDWLFLHFLATLGTSYLWWRSTMLGIDILALIYAIETGSYWLTPRSSNRKVIRLLRNFR